jgi:hypothetical protein
MKKRGRRGETVIDEEKRLSEQALSSRSGGRSVADKK